MYSFTDSSDANSFKYLVSHTDFDLDSNNNSYGGGNTLFTGISEYEAKELRLLHCDSPI